MTVYVVAGACWVLMIAFSFLAWLLWGPYYTWLRWISLFVFGLSCFSSWLGYQVWISQ